MNWEAIGAVAEALGAVAVVATLIYLSFQIRQNSKALMLNEKAFAAQENRERINALVNLNMNTMNSEWFWPVLQKLVKALPPGKFSYLGHSVPGTKTEHWESALTELSFEERGRYHFYCLNQWNNCQNLFFQQSLNHPDGHELQRTKQLIDSQVTKWKALGMPFRDDSEFDRYCLESLRKAEA